MYSITSLYKAFIPIYSFILVVLCAITMVSCDNLSCSNNIRKEKKEKLIVDIQIPLKPHFGLQANNQVQKVDLKHSAILSDSACPIKKAKKFKRVPKVAEDKQAIVLLHGLARVSSDFHNMIEVLKEKFPHATIVPLKSVDKHSNNGDKSSTPTSKLSIKEQAKLACEEIKDKITTGKHVVIIGHSQGGLRAFALVREHMKSLKEYGITFNHLITIATPWKGAPVFNHVNNVLNFNQKFNKIVLYLEAIQPGYSYAVRQYFFKKLPELSKKHPKRYQLFAKVMMQAKGVKGILDLNPESDFIRNFVPLGLKDLELPITAIAGVLTDFYQLFDSFSNSISHQALAELNATYAELIGGHPNSEHDMLLPVDTQHAEGLPVKNFKRVKVYGACHGNKVGFSVKRGLSELNNKKVIEKVVESIEEAFYEYKEEMVTKPRAAPAVAA